MSSTFDYKTVGIIKRTEENKLLNPLIKFKNYIFYADIICLGLSIFCFVYFFMESRQNKNWNYFRIIDYILQIIIFILNIIRYILFVNVKSFLKNNKDIYNNGEYYPKSINADSFPLAISISMIVYFLLYLIIKNKPSCQSKNFRETKYYFFNDESQKKFRIFIIIIPFIPIYFYIFINDIINDYKIKRIYINTIYNWDLSPIISIELTHKNDYELGHLYFETTNPNVEKIKGKLHFYSWKN